MNGPISGELSFRKATDDDVERLLEIHLAAYPDPRGVSERRTAFTANPYGGLADLVVAEARGEVVAHAYLLPMRAFFGGRAVPLGAIASVGVAPEVRGQGVGTALVRHLHARSDARGDALTMLYAFRQRFYSRLGYAASTPLRRLHVDPRAVPRSFVELARGRVRRARGEDREAIQRVYARAAARASGWFERPAAVWDRRLARERRQIMVLEGASGVEGYVAFELVQGEVHAETSLEVHELVHEEGEARRALLGFLGTMKDQVAEISLDVALDDPVDVVLVDADGRRFGDADVEHALGTVVGGPMVRIEDVPRALEARGYGAEGGFDLVVADAAEAFEIAVHVRSEGGVGEVSAARGGGALRTTRRGLAAILYGGVRVSHAASMGLVEGEPGLLRRVEPILAIPAPVPLDPF